MTNCEVCGATRNLDRHHIIPKRMGGSRNSEIHVESNLITLCRRCHRTVHEGNWNLIRSGQGIQVMDKHTGLQVMRRFFTPEFDVPSLFELLNQVEGSITHLVDALPYLLDDQLVEAFSHALSFGKRAWLLQAAILFEAQQRSTYGDNTLEAIARRFEIGIRQAQKYALVWKVFFARGDEEENVNIDAILLDEPSWYVVAVTETKEPEKWLAYAQDKKVEDPRYSVATFRRDVIIARFVESVDDAKEGRKDLDDLPPLNSWACPWVKLLCVHSGRPVPYRECNDCDFQEIDNYETKPISKEERDVRVRAEA